MTEEKKEEKKEEGQKSAEAPAAAIPPQAEAEPAPGKETQAPAVKEEKKVEIKREKPSNCAGCKKSIKKKRWYYRNGNFYCTHRCWKSTLKKEPKPEEAKA